MGLTADERTRALHGLMSERGLSAARVAELLHRKAGTVHNWRCRSYPQTIPTNDLRLLDLLTRRDRPRSA